MTRDERRNMLRGMVAKFAGEDCDPSEKAAAMAMATAFLDEIFDLIDDLHKIANK